jgi:cytosine/adenosine deaminase-related metal-dependent hydrolase
VRTLVKARNRTVAIEGDRIVNEGGKFDIVVECRDADVHPGLINAHDHLHRNHYGRLGRGGYPNAYRWAEDIQVRFRTRIEQRRRVTRCAALLSGAWKNLFAGVTTVVHHDAWEPDFDCGFPIRVAKVGSADSLGMAQCLERPAAGPFSLHVAEGVDGAAGQELAILDERGLLNEELIPVHAVGVRAGDVDRFRRSGAALAWCPTSNDFLFGRTASPMLLDSGCDLLLGSDSRLTGAGDLLDELRAARSCKAVDDERLAAAVGPTCARRLGVAEPSLEPGSRADLILLARPLMEARSSDVALTVVNGVARVARGDIARQLGPIARHGATMRVGGVERWTNEQGRMNR